MDIRFTKEQEELKREVIEFLEKEMTPEFLEELEGEDYATCPRSVPFSKKLAARGWLTLPWPKEYGGQGRSYLDQNIINEQLGYYWAPPSAHIVGAWWAGHGLLVHG